MRHSVIKARLFEELGGPIVAGLVLTAGGYGLFQCVPGFRPKHIRDIFVGLFGGSRGWSVLLFLAVYGLLLPAALRLKVQHEISSAVGAFFVCLALLLGADIFFELGLGLSSGATMWLLRAVFVALSLWGLGSAATRAALRAIPSTLAKRWSELGNAGWKVFAGLVVFFLVRQELHLYLTRGALLGDELYFWYSASLHFVEGGFERVLVSHAYTPAIPWMISFPSRLLGLSNPEWLYGMPNIIFALFLVFVFEIASTGWEWLTGLTLLFFVFLMSRDLMALYVGSLYGEASATLLTAVLMHSMLVAGKQGARRAGGSGIAVGLLLGFCILSKPPLSILCLLALPLVALNVVWSGFKWQGRAGLKQALGLLVFAATPYLIWKHALSVRGAKPEYAFSLRTLFQGGMDLSIPWRMICGLLNRGAPQEAYTLGLILVVVLALVKRNRVFLSFVGGLILIYWGFVFGLYATLWQHTEPGSAGRYIAHAAIACVLLSPLAFGEKRASGAASA